MAQSGDKESEIKLVLTSEGQAKFKAKGGKEFAKEKIAEIFDLLEFQQQSEKQKENIDLYFDTDNGDLRTRRSSLRIRQTGEYFELTLKLEKSRDFGLFDRQEVNWTLDKNELKAAVASNGFHSIFTEARQLLNLTTEPLVPVVRVQNNRYVRNLIHGSEEFEVSFDSFRVVDENGIPKSEEFVEVEIEAKSATAVSRLSRIQEHIDKTVTDLEPSKYSKYEMASNLKKGGSPSVDSILSADGRPMKWLNVLAAVAVILTLFVTLYLACGRGG